MNAQHPIFTLGHSTHSIEAFLALVQRHAISAIGDVRSTPASRFNPQFNRVALTRSLKAVGVGYVFLGSELGARSDDPNCYVDGKVKYARLASAPAFAVAIERLKRGRMDQRIAIMCSERDPLDCHRTLLVARHLAEQGVEVLHILADGSVEPHAASMMRLRDLFNLAEADLLHNEEELLLAALTLQEDRIAYVADEALEPEQGTA
ncbi:DUF488 domain-containing protein [Nocardioides sp. 1609]|uniref:DUF488 domain-containing protein n=1 Tax=Nocardioides sp. 1609 TaxID=2508327 RepID=UPI001ADD0BBA|nr:DUF488 domain-containing protein [Nocardioides sp. 1609]